jgi:glycolate oxidase
MAGLSELTSRLRAELGAAKVIDDRQELRTYECDGLAHYKVVPGLVVLAETTADVAAVVRACNEAGVPFVARGSGTGLSGGALPHADGVLVVTSRMRKILDVDRDGQRAVVEPGVINLHVTRAAAPSGYYYAPDPSSQQVCSIGGNVAENSGGAHCLKYGFTTNHVLGVEFVEPSGEVVEIGGKAPDPPGYDLLGAIVGSEGTLGIATRVTVRLTRAPESVQTLLAGFDGTDAAGQAVSAIIAAGVIPAAVEMMDALAIEAAEAAVHCGYPAGAGAVLVVELDGPASEVDAQFAQVRELCEKAGAFEIRIAADDVERALFWKGRKSAFAAVGRISPDYIVQDGVIPRTALPEVLRAIADLSAESGVRVANVFHAGDGNLHPLVLFDDAVPGQAERAEEVSGAILDLCLSTAGRSPESTASARTRPSTCRGCSPRRISTRCSWCGARSTRTGCPTRARCSPLRGCAARCQGRHRGAHPLVEAGLAEQF